MKIAKYYGFLILKFLGFLFGGSIILSIFYYLFLPTKVVNIMAIIYNLILFFIFGLMVGKKQTSKGYLAGIKIGLLLLFIIFLFNLFFFNTSFTVFKVIYYLGLLISSIIGSMVGINSKKE